MQQWPVSHRKVTKNNVVIPEQCWDVTKFVYKNLKKKKKRNDV
jgi:hypothetical protein